MRIRFSPFYLFFLIGILLVAAVVLRVEKKETEHKIVVVIPQDQII